jgi:aspartate racemase
VGRAGLLGTRYTMEQDFYSGTLSARGIETLIPDAADRERINDIIFNQLCLGIVDPESKRYFLDVVERLADRGAEGMILGCTEIGMLLGPGDTPRRLFDTTIIHATKAVEEALRQ